MLRHNRPQCTWAVGGLEATEQCDLGLDQGPTGPRGHQSLDLLEGNLEMAALASRAVPAGPCPQDPDQQTPRVAAAGTAAG